MFSSISFAGCKVPSFEKFTNAEWTVEKPYYFEDSGLGFSFQFDSPKATGTLYVYDLGISSDLEKTGNNNLGRQFQIFFLVMKKKYQMQNCLTQD